MTDVDLILQRLTALHPKRIDLSLGRMHRILERLDHPERRLPPVIHVAGTNGKGSTVAFMRGVLESAGRSVHVYTSPHLVRINERFRLGRPGAGALVDDAALAAALEDCERANAGAPITVFEMETAAGLLLFARNPADILLLEVGLGGRLDATNVVDTPLASVITPVSIDHVEFLGDTLDKIAAEKAGILKRGVPAVIAPQPDAALAVIESYAATIGAPPHFAGQEWTVWEERGRLVFQDHNGLLDLPLPRLRGHHQAANAGLAIAALRAAALPFALEPQHFETGLLRAEWPARMQSLAPGKLASLLPAGSELWLDGSHNADGGRVVAAALADLEDRNARPLVLICGMLATKDATGFLKNFAGLAQHLYAVPMPHQEKALPPEAIVAAAAQCEIAASAAKDVRAALSAIAGTSWPTPPRVLIAGSLYLAGDVLAENGTPPA